MALSPEQFQRGQLLRNHLDYGDVITYADLSAADRQLLEAYDLEEQQHWDNYVAQQQHQQEQQFLNEDLPF